MVILCVMKQNVYLNSLLFTHTLAGGSLRRHHGDEFCNRNTTGISDVISERTAEVYKKTFT